MRRVVSLVSLFCALGSGVFAQQSATDKPQNPKPSTSAAKTVPATKKAPATGKTATGTSAAAKSSKPATDSSNKKNAPPKSETTAAKKPAAKPHTEQGHVSKPKKDSPSDEAGKDMSDSANGLANGGKTFGEKLTKGHPGDAGKALIGGFGSFGKGIGDATKDEADSLKKNKKDKPATKQQ